MTDKPCKTCNQKKPIQDFICLNKCSNGKTYTTERSECKSCRSERVQKRIKERFPTPTQRALYQYANKLKRVYGITQEQANQLLASQNECCAICQHPISFQNPKQTRACIDHCHRTNIVRGVLCQNCNAGLGAFRDSSDNLTRAVQYLHQPANHS